jgi:hypothetical protein
MGQRDHPFHKQIPRSRLLGDPKESQAEKRRYLLW